MLTSFDQPVKDLMKDIPDKEVWEVWDQKLNVLLLHDIEGLKPLVVQGQYGLVGLVWLLKYLVYDHKISEELLDGKFG